VFTFLTATLLPKLQSYFSSSARIRLQYFFSASFRLSFGNRLHDAVVFHDEWLAVGKPAPISRIPLESSLS
jgi:hypothetical protein